MFTSLSTKRFSTYPHSALCASTLVRPTILLPATPMTTIYEVCNRSRFLRTMKSNFSQVKYWIIFLKLIQLCHSLLLSIFADIFVYIHVCPYSTYKASFFCFLSVRLLSVLRGHSFFPSPPQRPMTSDFEWFSIPDFIHYIYFPIWILEVESVFSLLNVQC